MDSTSIFVSYSSKDRPFALGFAKELQEQGIEVWIDQLGIKLGENWDNAIEEALEKSDTFLLLISPTSVKSPNVQDEVSIAINTDKKLIPILIRQCDLPMRWQRLQYADLTQDPEKGLKRVIESLGLKDKVAQKLKELLSLLGVPEPTRKKVVKKAKSDSGPEEDKEVHLEDLLVSEAEFDSAILMHERGIKKNKYLIVIVAVLSIVLATGLFLWDLGITEWMIVVGCLLLNLLSIQPYGGIKKRERKIDLMGLLKIKRGRLIRIIDNLADEEIDKFNQEFEDHITI